MRDRKPQVYIYKNKSAQVTLRATYPLKKKKKWRIYAGIFHLNSSYRARKQLANRSCDPSHAADPCDYLWSLADSLSFDIHIIYIHIYIHINISIIIKIVYILN